MGKATRQAVERRAAAFRALACDDTSGRLTLRPVMAGRAEPGACLYCHDVARDGDNVCALCSAAVAEVIGQWLAASVGHG